MKPLSKIQREIRRRAFDRVDRRKQEAADRQYARYTIDALEEVTGLPRLELETIAREVRTTYGAAEDGFFSIRNQILMVGSALVPIVILVWLITTFF